jgi:hypothetical protein
MHFCVLGSRTISRPFLLLFFAPEAPLPSPPDVVATVSNTASNDIDLAFVGGFFEVNVGVLAQGFAPINTQVLGVLGHVARCA